MEGLISRMKSHGETLHASSVLRLEKRPSVDAMGSRTRSKPVAVDYGGLEGTQSGWGSSQRTKRITDKQKRSESRPPSPKPHKKPARKPTDDSGLSDDEIDFLSSSRAGSDDASSMTKAKTKNTDEAPYDNGEKVAHKDQRDVLRTLKFKKNKPTEASSSQPRPPSSQPTTSQARSTSFKTSSSPPICPSPPTPKPKPKPKPRPRPVQKSKVIPTDFEPDASFSKLKDDAISLDDDDSDAKPSARTRSTTTGDPGPYAMPSPTRVPTSLRPKEFPLSTGPKFKPEGNTVRKPAPFAMPSPLSKDKTPGPRASAPRAPIPAAFPMLSPLSKDKRAGSKNLDKGKGKAKAQSDEEDDYDDDEDAMDVPRSIKGKKKARAPAPFPLSTQVLTSIRDVSRFKSGKRLSPGYSDEDRGSKKTKRDAVPLHDDTHADFYDEGDSLLVASIADPKTLCPYCDTPLPSNPSPLLLRLLAATKDKSSRDPRPSNALGRKAPLGIFIVVCQRHQFESQILPEAELKGWPKSIDWTQLGSRVRQMKMQLQALINDAYPSTNSNDWDILYTSSLSKPKKTPRSRCIFWQEIIEEVKAKGTRSVTGVRGQFANFEKAQPGYYGELGSAIIQQTLYDLFPPDSVDPAVFMPLTANEFVQRVLVPEVAVRLVMDDQSLSGEAGMKKALTILRESSSYGAAMFPDDSADAGKKKDVGMEASEQIVFDRAMKRRKELEEQDLLEEQARQEEEAMVLSEEPEDKKARKRKGTRAITQESDAQDSDNPPITAKLRPRPKPLAKAPSSTVMDVTAAPPKRARSRTTRSAASTDVQMHGLETTAEMSSYDSDIGPPPGQRSNAHRASSEARRRSPSFSESQPVLPTKPRPIRSTKGSFEALSLSDSSESEKSRKSAASKKTRSSSRAPAAKPPSQKKVQSSSDMDIDSDSSGPEIVKADTMKTPKPKPKFKPKAASPVALNDNTPKPATKTMVNDTDLPPLLRARNKREASSIFGATNISNSNAKSNSSSQQDFQVNYSVRKAGSPVKQPSQDFTWLLGD